MIFSFFVPIFNRRVDTPPENFKFTSAEMNANHQPVLDSRYDPFYAKAFKHVKNSSQLESA